MIYALALIAIGVAWLLPGHYFPWATFQQEAIASSGAVMLVTAALVSTDARRFPVPWIAATSLALVVVPALQWATGVVPFIADAVLPMMYLAAFGLTIVAASTLVQFGGERIIAGLLLTMIIAALVSSGIGLAQWLQVDELPYVDSLASGQRVYANFTQPNQLASLCGLGILGVVWCYETRRVSAIVSALAALFIGFAIIMTQSRTAWAFLCMLVLWWALMRRRLALRTTPAAVILGAGLFVLATFSWQSVSTWLDNGATAALADRMAFGRRWIHWGTLWDAAWRRPWLGYGWMQVGTAQQAAALDHAPAHEWITYSHNLLLDLLVWNGVPLGAAVFAAGMGWATARCMRCMDVHTWILLAAGGVLFVHALFEYPLAYAFFLLPLGVIVGAIEGRAMAGRSTLALRIARPAFAAALIAVTGMLAWVWAEYIRIEEVARQVRLYEVGYLVEGHTPKEPEVMLLDSQRDFLWFRLTEAREGMSARDIDRMRIVSERFALPAAMLRYALAAGLNGRDTAAGHTLRLLCHMWSPKNCDEARVSWNLAQERFAQLRRIEFPRAAAGSIAPPTSAP